MEYDKKKLDEIKDMLSSKMLTLSVAESVTSGHLQAAFSAATEASKFYQGGISVYNIGQKCRHLNIEPIAAAESDCVTEKVAKEMSVNVNKLFVSEYGIAITGYATKMPEKGVNDLFAYFSIAFKDEILVSKKINSFKEETTDVQLDYTTQVINEFYSLLKNE